MAVYPTQGGSDGSWGTETSAFHAVTRDLATGKIKDGALMVTSAAPTVDAGVANKKYVDDSFNGDVPVTVDSDSVTLAKNHAYLAQTSGFVTAYILISTGGGNLAGFVGITTNPAGAGVKVANSLPSTSKGAFISFFVPNGKYFEITEGGAETIVITWTPFVSGGGAPIDQD